MTPSALPPRLARLPRREAGGSVILVAATFRSRLLGLLGVGGLPPAHGLLIRPAASVHTIGMRFGLDLIWLGQDGAVLRIDHGVGRWRHRRCRGARAVIETQMGDGNAVALAACRAGVAIVDGH